MTDFADAAEADLLGYVDKKERARVGAAFLAHAESLKVLAANSESLLAEQRAERVRQFYRDTVNQAITREWKALGRDPVVTAGMLVSPTLVAYAEWAVERMKRRVVEKRREDAEKARRE